MTAVSALSKPPAISQRSVRRCELLYHQRPAAPLIPGFRSHVPGYFRYSGEHTSSTEFSISVLIHTPRRARDVPAPLPSSIVGDITTRLANITELFSSIVPDLQGPNAWRYQRQVSSGVQEFVEAVSFQHYLTTQCLIMVEETQRLLPKGVQLMEDDYLLGLYDLVGELMRFAITGMATGGKLPGGDSRSDEMQSGGDIEALGGVRKRDVVQDLRELRTAFEGMDTRGGSLGRDVEKKMEVMRTCVEKVENAAYGMIIRGRERPKGWVPEERIQEVVESY